jgi:hypothetical protein
MRLLKKALPVLIGVVIGLFLGKNQSANAFISKIPFVGPMLAGGSTSTEQKA